MNYETIKGLLDEFLQTHYNGSFSPNGVRLHPRHGDDGGRSGSFVGGDEGQNVTNDLSISRTTPSIHRVISAPGNPASANGSNR